MPILAIVLTAWLLGASGSEATSPNEKLTFWDQQRRGANGGGGSDPEKWFGAAAEVGIEYVRLSPANWSGAGRDFLLGDADEFERIPDSDLRKLIEILDIAARSGVKIVVTMFSLPGARWRQHNDNHFDYRLWNEEEFQAQAMAFWKELAGHLRHHSTIVGYNPLNEPHPARDAGFEDDGSEGFTRLLSENRLQPVVEWSRRFETPPTRVIAAEFACDRRVPGARGYLAELIAQLNTHKWHWAFYSCRDSDWDGLDYELGTQKLDWEYWQERDKGVDHERLIERHDNPLWEVLKSEFPETQSFPQD